MANFNKCIFIGRLTRDPEIKTFQNGGKVARIGFATTNRKKNAQSGQWEDDPMFLDCDVFNRGEHGTLANVVEQYCRKGSQICLEGRLVLETWDDKTTGQKRSKHKLMVDSVQLLDPKPADGSGNGQQRQSAPASRGAEQASPEYGGGNEIPF